MSSMMSSNIESSRLSEEVEDSTSMSDIQDSLDPSSVTRDSMITSSDAGDSSVLPMNTNEKRRSTNPGGPIPFYRRRRFWAMCLAINVVLSAVFIPLLFLVIIPAAAQSSVNKSKLDLQVINITKATNDSFTISMLGEASGAGPFSAKIEFNGPIQISYNGNEIGYAELDNLSVSGGKGVVTGKDKTFQIEDKKVFTDFASTTLKDKSFTWTLRGSANVRTLGITINNLKLSKEMTILGSGGFNTSLVSLNVTQQPDNTLDLEVVTSVYNPSPVGIELGDMNLQLSYNGTIIANATAKGVFLGTKENTLTLRGTSAIPTTDVDKQNYLQIMNSYLTGTPITTTTKILSIISPSGEKVDWINEAVSSFNLNAVVGQTKPPQVIANADFGEMNIKFTPDEPYSPTISSKNATATLNLPFHVDLQILTIGQNITLLSKGKPVAMINVPESNVTTTSAGISLDVAETKMKVIDQDAFSDFLVGLTTTTGSSVDIAGTSNCRVKSILGDNVPINGIPFNISTGLQGFNQFSGDGSPPTVSKITVLEGAPGQLTVGLVVTITNPSKYSMSSGKVSLDMFYKDAQIGTAVIQDLSIVPGPNDLVVLATFDGPEDGPGKEVLTAFLTGQTATVNIKGSENSTNIASLVKAFKAVNIATNIPPLGLNLVKSSKIVVVDMGPNPTPMGVVDIENSFVAPISIYTLNSTFSFNGTVLGSVQQDMRNNPIYIPGNSVQEVALPVNLVTDPVVSFSVVRNLAIQNGLDVSVFDSMIVLGKINVPGVDPNVKPTPEAIRAFDIGKFTTTALSKIPVTVNMDARVAVGDYFMSMSYKQDIISEADPSIVKLIPLYAQPLLQPIMEQTQLNLDSVFVKNIDVGSFDVFTAGTITGTGPIASQINFTSGVDLRVDNVLLGTLGGVPPVIVDPVAGAKLDSPNPGRFQIADIPTFTAFVGQMMTTTGSVTGEISSNVIVTTPDFTLGPLQIQKPIDLPGFNNLQSFQLLNFTFPSPDNPNIIAEVALNNPTISGIELGTIVFNIFAGTDFLATITGDNVVIVPKGTSTVTFQGPVSLPQDRAGPVFAGLLSKSIPIIIQGVSVKPPKATGEVVWLTSAFQNFVMSVPFDLSTLGKAPPSPAAPAAPAPPPQ